MAMKVPERPTPALTGHVHCYDLISMWACCKLGTVMIAYYANIRSGINRLNYKNVLLKYRISQWNEPGVTIVTRSYFNKDNHTVW